MSPLIAMYFATGASENVVFGKDHIEFDFSPKSLKLVKEPREELLKPIETYFTED